MIPCRASLSLTVGTPPITYIFTRPCSPDTHRAYITSDQTMSSSVQAASMTAQRSSSSSDPVTPTQPQPPLASYFVENDQAPVILIERSNAGISRRQVVTEDLLKSYIERDYTVRTLSVAKKHVVTQAEARLCHRPKSIIASS